jgi:hypothetical protein
LYTRKSPLGDLVVEDKKSTFSTAPKGDEVKNNKRIYMADLFEQILFSFVIG